tara:strand:+ start:44 stop:736 length:693 start_codon:yes stop_codon:yes gene_type:complete
MKNKIKLLFPSLILSLILASSCTKLDSEFKSPCKDGDCNSTFQVVYKGQPINPNLDGSYDIEFDGLGYFQITGNNERMDGNEFEINGVPQIDTKYDTDYFIAFDSLRFTIPTFSYLGWFTDGSLNNPVPMGNYTYSIGNLIENGHPPYNIAGYQIPDGFCPTCPNAESIIGSHSKYTYEPTQNIFLDDEMVGDTINVFIQVDYNTTNGFGQMIYSKSQQEKNYTFQINII